MKTSMDQSMESLALPRELLWDGKSEPTSPPSSELFANTELTSGWLLDDNFANEIKLLTNDAFELKSGFELTQELMNCDDLIVEFIDLKDEHWQDYKPLTSSQALDFSVGTVFQPTTITKVQQNNIDIESFDTGVLTQLTPPQSPPLCVTGSPVFSMPIAAQSSVEAQITNNNVLQPVNAPIVTTAVAATISNGNTATTTADAGQSLQYNNWPEQPKEEESYSQIVDEILNTRVKELNNWNDDECESQSSYSAPSITDEEWMPNSSGFCSSASSSPVYDANDESLPASSATGMKLAAAAISGIAGKKRTRPYGRGIEDRKLRKKEQNKNAATRYRQKKKQEMEHVLTEELQLSQRNEELKSKLGDIKREAQYLKSLIREFLQNKK